MKISSLIPTNAIVMAAFSLLVGCSNASYEYVGNDSDKDNSDPGEPKNITTDDDDGQGPDNFEALPTAELEVLRDGQRTTIVNVNQEVVIRPSASTLDPDNIGKTSCDNPGIVKAEYDLQEDAEREQVRQNADDCKNLEITYSFSSAGEYAIQMIVTSDENEKATASTVVRVVDSSGVSDDLPHSGFSIAARPLYTKTNRDIQFTSQCTTNTPHTIAWNFGNSATAEGVNPTYAYPAEGQYRVNAVCTDEDGNELTAWLTVSIYDGIETIEPGDPVDPVEPKDPVEPVEKIVVANDILFEFDEHDKVLPGADETLDNIAAQLTDGSGFTELLIEGHTDYKGTLAYNQDLSIRRAETIKAWLIERYGIPADKIRTVGHGETQPVDTRRTDEARQLNRRVEFTIFRD